MSGAAYYRVRVKLKDTEELPSGKQKVKKWNEYYLVKDVDILGVREKIQSEFSSTQCEWEIDSITQTNYVNVIE